MKLNLGCGGDVRPGYINIDLYVNLPGVQCLDVTKLPYDPQSCTEIVAQDVFEHLSHRECREVLARWCNLLTPGGTIKIRCPDLETQCNCLTGGYWDVDVFCYMMFGGQDAIGNYHKSGWTLSSLGDALVSNGCRVTVSTKRSEGLTRIKETSCNPNLYVEAVKL